MSLQFASRTFRFSVQKLRGLRELRVRKQLRELRGRVNGRRGRRPLQWRRARRRTFCAELRCAKLRCAELRNSACLPSAFVVDFRTNSPEIPVHVHEPVPMWARAPRLRRLRVENGARRQFGQTGRWPPSRRSNRILARGRVQLFKPILPGMAPPQRLIRHSALGRPYTTLQPTRIHT